LAGAKFESLQQMSKDTKPFAESEINRIRAQIEKRVEEHFAKGENAYYLSQLGNDLGEDRKLLERLTRTKLADFIKANFDFEIGKTGIHQNIFYIHKPGTAQIVPSGAVPRYNKRFWAAFARPLEGKERRFINLGSFDFGHDQNEIASVGGETREISPKYITEDGQYSNSTEILGRIREWLAEQNLEEEPFIIGHNRSIHAGRGETFLDILLNSLSGDQLKRVTLPLDVVKLLSGRRIS